MNTNTPMKKQNTAAAVAGLDAFETFADQAVGVDAQLVKFTRGTWTTGPDNEAIDAGAAFLAVVTGIRHGYIKWSEGKPVDRRMAAVAGHPLAVSRGELGDLDEDTWPMGKDGVPADPWQFTYELPLVDLETEGPRLYATSSIGGRQCVGKLARTYAQHARKQPGELPIVELGCETYQHERFGPIQKPALRITGWVADPDWTPPEPSPGPASLSRELNDEIPF